MNLGTGTQVNRLPALTQDRLTNIKNIKTLFKYCNLHFGVPLHSNIMDTHDQERTHMNTNAHSHTCTCMALVLSVWDWSRGDASEV